MKNTRTLFWFVLILLALGSVGTAWGQSGLTELGGDGECTGDDCGEVEGGGDDSVNVPCNPPLGCSVGSLWFPVGEGDSLDEILDDLEAEIEDLDPSFDSDDTGPPDTRTFSSSTFNTFCLRETGTALNKVGVAHPGAGLNAKIRKVTEDPTGGKLTIILKSSTTFISFGALMIDTYNGDTAADVNDDIEAALDTANYEFETKADYFIITEMPSGADLNQVRFQSTDEGITTGEVALEPDTLDSTWCSTNQ